MCDGCYDATLCFCLSTELHLCLFVQYMSCWRRMSVTLVFRNRSYDIRRQGLTPARDRVRGRGQSALVLTAHGFGRWLMEHDLAIDQYPERSSVRASATAAQTIAFMFVCTIHVLLATNVGNVCFENIPAEA